jgi:hypothetical protein
MCRNCSVFAVAALIAATVTPAIGQAPATIAKRDVALEIACGAQAAIEAPAPLVRVAGGQEKGKTLFATGEAIILTGGSAQGLSVGQEYFVRRLVPDRFAKTISDGVQPRSVHTAGWIRVVDVQPASAIATVTHACDGLMDGDYLEPFTMPALPAAGPATGEPDYRNAGHVILGDERRQVGGPGSLMVIDRGSDHGLRAGQWLTIFRQTQGASAPIFRVGEMQVITVHPETSLVKIQSSKDAVYVGDQVAIHR